MNEIKFNNWRAIEIGQPVKGNKNGRTFEYLPVTFEKQRNAGDPLTGTPIAKRNFFADSKHDAPIFTVFSKHLVEFGAEANKAENLAKLPPISAAYYSEELPKGVAYHIKDNKGKFLTIQNGEDKGKQVIGTRLTTLLIEEGDSIEVVQRNYINSKSAQNLLIVTAEDVADYKNPKAQQVYIDMLARVKELEAAQQEALPG